ncbi:MAG TPA: hypothetical protein VEB22_03960 [Phycisphaerales bacterium]|nr:hypothetical protein [Phycisphaerales bacterium]
MLVDVNSAGDLRDFLHEARVAAWAPRNELGQRMGRDIAFYLGHQWLLSAVDRKVGNGTASLPPQLDPDVRRPMRATLNRIAKHAQRVAASTRPDTIEIEAHPGDFGVGLGATASARVLESTANTLVDLSGYVRARRRANHRRTMVGCAGVGFYMLGGERALNIDGQDRTLPDAFIRAFSFYPHNLILDPQNDSSELQEHDYVILEEVMTAAKIKRLFGVTLDETKLRTVGDLTPFEQIVGDLTGGRVFHGFKMHSRTPGARVVQVYLKGMTGRFDRYWCAIEEEGKDDSRLRILKGEGANPWGGDGLPLALYQGHFDPDSPFGISDVHNMAADQKWLNAYATFILRTLRNHANYKWLVDTRSAPKELSAESWKKQINNEIGGVLFYDAGRREQGINPPTITSYPPPPGFVLEGMRESDANMQQQAHRSEGSYGATKSHVPDASFKQALIEGDKVMSARVHDDIEQDMRMAGVLVGTTVRLVRSMTPSVLGVLRRKGFGRREFSILAAEDPGQLSCALKVRESSVRHRPYAEKKQDLLEASTANRISPQEARAALASDFFDSPLTAMDRQMSHEATRAAEEVAAGKDWQALPLGQHGQFFIEAFTQMLFDARVRDNNGAKARLSAAIQAQRQMGVEDMINSDPKLYIERQVAEAKAAEEQAQADAESARGEADRLAELEAGQEPAAGPISLADAVDHFMPKAAAAPIGPPDPEPGTTDLAPGLSVPASQAA